MALIIFVGGAIWYFFDYQLKLAFIAIRKYQLLGIYYAVKYLPLELLPSPYFDWIKILPARVLQDLSIVQQISPKTLSPEVAIVLSQETGEMLRYPFTVLFVIFAIIIHKSSILLRYRRTHTMKSLLKQEVVNWPQTTIVRDINLLDYDLDSGPWAMTLTPLMFAKKYKLIDVVPSEKAGATFSKTAAPEFKIILKRARSERAFSAQLGRPWHGVDHLLPHRRAVFAILASRGCRDTHKSRELTYQLARTAGEGRINLMGVDELINKHLKNKLVEKILKSHAYEFTIFASLLLFAREDGVIASADFLWVKPVDRLLWYVINNVGRQTPAAEVAGIFCHWYHELALKRSLSVPVVTGAVDALELALNDIIYMPDDQEREEIYKRHQQQAEQRQGSESVIS